MVGSGWNPEPEPGRAVCLEVRIARNRHSYSEPASFGNILVVVAVVSAVVRSRSGSAFPADLSDLFDSD